MITEIERKFRVEGPSWRNHVTAIRRIRQFYLARTALSEVRVRIVDARSATLTVKSATAALARREIEVPLGLAEAGALEPLKIGDVIQKTRHIVAVAGVSIEIDVFDAPHLGLVLAEIESVDRVRPDTLPEWLGAEVTGDRRYYNATLAGLGP